MVDQVNPYDLRLNLSAVEVKNLTGWPDAMVEDYINILSELIEFANAINDLIADSEAGASELAELGVGLSLVRSRLFALKDKHADHGHEGSANSVALGKIRADINVMVRRCAEVLQSTAENALQIAKM